MAIYLMLTKLTEKGRDTLEDRPERIKEVNKEVEALGAKVISQYALLGGYDFANIIEAPDNEIVARVAAKLCARGTLESTTFAAIDIDKFIANLKKK